MHELSKQFRFEAAHTLNRVIEAEPSRRIHGHSYRAEITLRGEPDPQTAWIWRHLAGECPPLARVTVYRDSAGDTCSYFGPTNQAA